MIEMFAAVLLAAASPAAVPAAQSTAACPRTRGRVLESVTPMFPDGAHPTNARVSFLLDLGSDGRVRRVVMAESSGDAAVDDAAAKAIGQYRFAPATAACVSASSAVSRYFTLPPEALASPPADAAPNPSPVPCAAPFARPVGFPLPQRRKVPGTVTVDVALDGAARVTAVRLVKSSGNPRTDYAATSAARNGRYAFERFPGCGPAPTTYRVEMTFH
jgi:TonB family protein